MPANFWMFFVAGLIPMIVGSIWYSPKVFGTKWMKINGFTEEYLAKGNMAAILGVSYLLSVLMAFALSGMVIHQTNVLQLLYPEVAEAGSAAQATYNEFMSDYGEKHRTAKHGAIHGIIYGIMFVLPLIGINALFERRGWGYILIHLGYWLITLSSMGALLCATLNYSSIG